MSTQRLGWPGWLALTVLGLGAATAGAEPLRLTPQEAVRRALRENLNLKLDRLDPDLTGWSEQIAEAAFRPLLFGSADVAGAPASTSGLGVASQTTAVGGEVGVRKTFSIGTTLEGRFSTDLLFGGRGLDPSYETRLYVQARQALLQGISRSANEAAIVGARLNREAAGALLQRQAELIAASTLKGYWDLRAALAKVAIEGSALQMAEQTLKETEALIGAGKLPASEKASAAYTVQIQRRAKLAAEQALANVRDRLSRIIGAVGATSLETPELTPVSVPRRSAPRWSLAELQKQALTQRGDYRSLLITTKIRRTEEGVARHRLLPRLDLVAGLNLSGLSGDSSDPTTASGYSSGYWRSYELKRVGWSAGLVLEVPLGNLEAKARRELAVIQVRRAELGEQVAVQELSLELNLAWRSLQLARQQLRLTEEAARVAEEKLRNETERYKAGKITAHILSTVQLEVVAERLTREQALADLVKAVVDMQAASGGLLGRLGLSAEGGANEMKEASR